MRSLIVYYSFSGTSRKLAECVAKDLGADLSEVRAQLYRPGLLGFIRASTDSWRGRLPPIEVSGPSPESYDFVLLMAPVWAGHASTPIRAYLFQNRGRLKRAGFVLACGNRCPPRAFDEMAELCGVKPEFSLTLREAEIKKSAYLPRALTTLLSSLKIRQAA